MIKNIAIVGCGAIGSRIAVELASRNWTLHLYDMDKVADDNIGTSAYGRFDVGVRKVDALSTLVSSRNGLSISLNQDITRKSIRTNIPLDLVVDCLDNSFARNKLQPQVGDGIIVHVGVTIGMGEVIWGDQHYGRPDPENDICTHQLGKKIIALTATIAVLAIDEFIYSNNTRNYLINESGKVMF